MIDCLLSNQHNSDKDYGEKDRGAIKHVIENFLHSRDADRQEEKGHMCQTGYSDWILSFIVPAFKMW